MPEYNPTIWDAKNLTGVRFSLTDKEERSVGKEAFGQPKFRERGIAMRLVDYTLGDRAPDNVEISEGGGAFRICAEYGEANDDGHGPFCAPRKDEKTGEIERWPDTGRVKTKSTVDFYVVREVVVHDAAALTHVSGKHQGEPLMRKVNGELEPIVIQPGDKLDVWFKASVDKKLLASIETARRANKSMSEQQAILVLTFDPTKPPMDMYQVAFTEWDESQVPAPAKVPEVMQHDDAAVTAEESDTEKWLREADTTPF